MTGDARPGSPPLPRQPRRAGRRRARWTAVPAVALLLGTGGALWPGPASVTCAVLAAAVAAGWFLTGSVAHRWVTVTVHGGSMEPTYHDGDGVLVRRTDRVRAGHVVVLEAPAGDRRWPRPPVPARSGPTALAGRRWIIKRVAAAPGDPVPLTVRDSVPATDLRVPLGRLVLLGDNPAGSLDSRQVGYFPTNRVLGVAVAPSTDPTRR